MLNRVCLVGRLTNDIELKKTNTGKDVVKFSLAVNKIGDGVDYINCEAWNKTAEFLSKYGKKGSKLSVDGRIQTRKYENAQGVTVYVTEVVADYVDLLDSRQQDEKPQFNTGKNNVVTDEDLPF